MCPSLTSLIQELPRLPGTYALLLDLPIHQQLIIGALGEVDLPAGRYVYCGSALGPGGLRSRLGRHLRGNGKRHWHIDFFRWYAHPTGFCYTLSRPDAPGGREQAKRECQWSQTIAGLPRSTIPAPHFGASDCRSTCRSHLVALGPNCHLESVHRALAQVTPRLFCQISSPI